MNLNQEFFDFLRQEEGYEHYSYPDSNKVPTIGIGHKLTRSEKASGKIKINGDIFPYRKGLTDKQIIALCEQDCRIAVNAVNKLVHVQLSQNQFNALVDLTFNIGMEAFADSTLLRLLNEHHYEEVPTQMRRWIHDDGEVVQGLINRREADVRLWSTP